MFCELSGEESSSKTFCVVSLLVSWLSLCVEVVLHSTAKNIFRVENVLTVGERGVGERTVCTVL
jgi:hypothetical protein